MIPSNKILIATDGVLQLSPRPPKAQRSMPIDIFFSSLAAVHQAHAIGVVLSRTDTDGTLALKLSKIMEASALPRIRNPRRMTVCL